MIDLTGKARLKLNLGCGDKRYQDFIGIDKKQGFYCDILLDIGKDTLPYKDNTVETILLSHVIEHLDLSEIYFCLEECYRALEKNGKLAIVFPDFDKMKNVNNYDFLLEILCSDGRHKTVMTIDIVRTLLECFGFLEFKEVMNFNDLGVDRSGTPYESKIISTKK